MAEFEQDKFLSGGLEVGLDNVEAWAGKNTIWKPTTGYLQQQSGKVVVEVYEPGTGRVFTMSGVGDLGIGWWGSRFLTGVFSNTVNPISSDKPFVAGQIGWQGNTLIVKFVQAGPAFGHFRATSTPALVLDTPATGFVQRSSDMATSSHVWDTTSQHPDGPGHIDTRGVLNLDAVQSSVGQRLVTGLKRINCGPREEPLTVVGYADGPDNQQNVNITMNSYLASTENLLGGALSWWYPFAENMITGTWSAGPAGATATRKFIPFHAHGGPTPPHFTNPPKVLVWLSGFMSSSDTRLRIDVSVAQATTSGFYLVLNSWNGDGQTSLVTGSYIAYDPVKLPQIQSGEILRKADGKNWTSAEGTETVSKPFNTVIAAFSALNVLLSDTQDHAAEIVKENGEEDPAKDEPNGEVARRMRGGLNVSFDVTQATSTTFDWIAQTGNADSFVTTRASYICY